MCRREIQSDVQALKFLKEHLHNGDASWEYKQII